MWQVSILDGNDVHFTDHLTEYATEDEAFRSAVALCPEVYRPKALVIRMAVDNSKLSLWQDLWADDVRYVVRDVVQLQGEYTFAPTPPKRFGLIDKWKFWTHAAIFVLGSAAILLVGYSMLR